MTDSAEIKKYYKTVTVAILIIIYRHSFAMLQRLTMIQSFQTDAQNKTVQTKSDHFSFISKVFYFAQIIECCNR